MTRQYPRVYRIAAAWALVAAVIAAALSPRIATGAGTAVCANKAPKSLKFSRKVGKRYGRLFWHGAGKHRRYRVFRNGAIVGQTFHRSMRVAVRPGATYQFAVRPLTTSGGESICAGELMKKLRWYPPFRVRHVSVRRVPGKLRARLSWARVRRGDGRLAGYRVYRDGKVYRQVKPRRHWIRVAVTPGTHEFRIVAADTRGAMGTASRTVRINIRHSPPSMPGRLRIGRVTDSSVELGWGLARKRSSPIVGYRIFRNNVPVAQVQGLALDIGNLAPATDYRFSVAAVDRWGYVGQATWAQTTTAMPPPTRGKLHAFVLATTDESFVDLQRHYEQIGTIYPTYYDCRRSDAGIRGKDDPLVTRWAQLRRILVMPRFDCQSGTALNLMLRNPGVREATLAGLVDLVQRYGYDGINLDFEAGFAEDRNALTSFVAEMARRMHALGKRVTVEVSAKFTNTTTGRSGFYDYPALGRVADNVFVMAWGWHWTTSAPGPSDELQNVIKVADYTATMPNKEKYVLGLPLYAHDWPWNGGAANPSTPREYGEAIEIARAYGATPRFDDASYTKTFDYVAGGVPHHVWFGDFYTVSRRIRLARMRGLGLGFWRLGREDQRIWNDPQIAPGTPWP